MPSGERHTGTLSSKRKKCKETAYSVRRTPAKGADSRDGAKCGRRDINAKRLARKKRVFAPEPASVGSPATAFSKSSPSGNLATPPLAKPLSTTSHTCTRRMHVKTHRYRKMGPSRCTANAILVLLMRKECVRSMVMTCLSLRERKCVIAVKPIKMLSTVCFLRPVEPRTRAGARDTTDEGEMR